jgi:OmpR family response regulator RpaB
MEAYNQKILIVVNEDTIRQTLFLRLTNLGYKIILVPTDKEIITIFENVKPDLVILDIMLPNFYGYEMCRKIRRISKVPILIITTFNSISERITGLELGANDYLIKPFSVKELEARVRSILYDYSNHLPPTLNKKQNIFFIENLVITVNSRSVIKDNIKIRLTNTEFNILYLLLENAGIRLSRKIILNSIWGYTPERDVDTRIVDVHISRLRSKIENDRTNPNIILTVRGSGYMFQKF